MRKQIAKNYHKLLAFMIMLAMVLSMVQTPLKAYAAEEYEASFTDYNEDSFDSYEEAAAAAAANEDSQDGIVDSGENVDVSSDIIKCGTIANAGKYVREQMTNRMPAIYFNINNKEGYSIEQAYNAIKEEIFKETGNFKQGDYLYWNWGGTDVSYRKEDDGSLSLLFEPEYLSTAYQEKVIDAEVSRLLNNEFAGWQNMNEYEKVRMVYKWVTGNFVYVSGSNNHSTYSGIINHKTVCQGYVTTMYRLLGEMGVNIRVIANADHGWNIVQLGRYWYNFDATWDTGMIEIYWDYFLTDPYEFTLLDHQRGAKYSTDEFLRTYPMGDGAYDYEAQKDVVGIYYRTHVQSYGWQNFRYDGTTSGTTGEGKRLEGIEIKLKNTGSYDLGVEYRTHIQSYGWEGTWKKNGQMSGTNGQAKRLEAIQIRLTGADADKFNVWYRVHAQSYGWLGWAKNGQEAGTAGQAKRLESIQMLILPKDETPGGLMSYSYVDYGKNSKSTNATAGLVNYRTHVQSFGWQGYVYDGSISGTSGLAKRLEGINISLGNTGYEGGIRYTTHVQSYGWQGDKNKPETWAKDGAMSGTSGEAKRLEGIRIQLYGEVAEHYDVYYRVHAQSYGWLDWAKNGADAGTAGLAKRLEAIQIVLVPKNGVAPGATARPFVSK